MRTDDIMMQLDSSQSRSGCCLVLLFCRFWDKELKLATKELRKPNLTAVLIRCYWRAYAVPGFFVLSLVGPRGHLVTISEVLGDIL